jgi:hypothetical protein
LPQNLLDFSCMVALDNSAHFGHRIVPRLKFTFGPVGIGIAAVAMALVLGAIVARGFSENGFRLGSQLAWRYASFVFFAVLMADPVRHMAVRYFPGFKISENIGSRLIWGFCASYGVYLLSVFLPNVIRPSLGATLMVLFSGGVALIMALTAVPLHRPNGGAVAFEKARRAMQGTAVTYFWLCYSIMALARISGPHRPDAFYDISLSLMVVGLLARFGNHLFSHWPDPKVSNLRRPSVSN